LRSSTAIEMDFRKNRHASLGGLESREVKRERGNDANEGGNEKERKRKKTRRVRKQYPSDQVSTTEEKNGAIRSRGKKETSSGTTNIMEKNEARPKGGRDRSKEKRRLEASRRGKDKSPLKTK